MRGDILDGIRVVSTAINVPGPVAAARLAALGARVTKIEPPAGDPLQLFSPAWYAELTAGQDVTMLDLKSAEGRERLNECLARADLLLTASRPAALARLGLSWDTLHAGHPRLCHVGIVGFPPPHEDESGHDLTYQARLGLIEPPSMPATLLVDLAGAERAVSEALGLLLRRERTGVPGQRWASLYNAAEPFAAPRRHGITAPGSALGGGLPGYGIYEAAEGHIAVAALEPHFLERLEEMAEGRPLTHETLRTIFGKRTAAEWEAWGRTADVPIAKVRNRA